MLISQRYWLVDAPLKSCVEPIVVGVPPATSHVVNQPCWLFLTETTSAPALYLNNKFDINFQKEQKCKSSIDISYKILTSIHFWWNHGVNVLYDFAMKSRTCSTDKWIHRKKNEQLCSLLCVCCYLHFFFKFKI